MTFGAGGLFGSLAGVKRPTGPSNLAQQTFMDPFSQMALSQQRMTPAVLGGTPSTPATTPTSTPGRIPVMSGGNLSDLLAAGDKAAKDALAASSGSNNGTVALGTNGHSIFYNGSTYTAQNAPDKSQIPEGWSLATSDGQNFTLHAPLSAQIADRKAQIENLGGNVDAFMANLSGNGGGGGSSAASTSAQNAAQDTVNSIFGGGSSHPAAAAATASPTAAATGPTAAGRIPVFTGNATPDSLAKQAAQAQSGRTTTKAGNPLNGYSSIAESGYDLLTSKPQGVSSKDWTHYLGVTKNLSAGKTISDVNTKWLDTFNGKYGTKTPVSTPAPGGAGGGGAGGGVVDPNSFAPDVGLLTRPYDNPFATRNLWNLFPNAGQPILNSSGGIRG